MCCAPEHGGTLLGPADMLLLLQHYVLGALHLQHACIAPVRICLDGLINRIHSAECRVVGMLLTAITAGLLHCCEPQHAQHLCVYVLMASSTTLTMLNAQC